jgi:hypothetical protein
MKLICLFCLCAVLGLTSGEAQPSSAGGPMGSGPGLSGSTVKLFGENTIFSAALQIQTENPQASDAMTVPGKIYFDHGKSRFEMNMSEAKGGMMTPEAAASMKSMGLDKTIMISRPDKRAAYQIYPGMQAYVETQLKDTEAASSTNDFKLEMTELAKETMDGHPCVKAKAVVTSKDGTKYESLVWKATDLKQFPVRIERTEGRMNVVMSFRDIDLSKPAPELFEPPTGSTKYESVQAMAQAILVKRMGGGVPEQVPGK